MRVSVAALLSNENVSARCGCHHIDKLCADNRATEGTASLYRHARLHCASVLLLVGDALHDAPVTACSHVYPPVPGDWHSRLHCASVMVPVDDALQDAPAAACSHAYSAAGGGGGDGGGQRVQAAQGPGFG